MTTAPPASCWPVVAELADGYGVRWRTELAECATPGCAGPVVLETTRCAACRELHTADCKPWQLPAAEPEPEPQPEAAVAGVPALPASKRYHFFLCHHQGSGGDQAYSLFLLLTARGYKVWYDNGQAASSRNLQGMRKGVTESVCLLVFLSSRHETADHPDANGLYEGPFTR
jgi:hypothetical protein